MGQKMEHASLFSEFNREGRLPAGHLLRRVDAVLDLSFVRRQIPANYSATGRPSIDPELMVRKLLIRYHLASDQSNLLRTVFETSVEQCLLASIASTSHVVVDGGNMRASAAQKRCVASIADLPSASLGATKSGKTAVAHALNFFVIAARDRVIFYDISTCRWRDIDRLQAGEEEAAHVGPPTVLSDQIWDAKRKKGSESGYAETRAGSRRVSCL